MHDESGYLGQKASNRSKTYIRNHFALIREADDQKLKTFLRNEPNACKATVTNQLLVPKWTEQRNAYKLTSRITEKDEKRIKSLINESRYSNIG